MDVDLEFCKGLAKAELHSHLNGCVREATLLEFANLDKRQGRKSVPNLASLKVVNGDSRTLSQCFNLFDDVHQLVSTPKRLKRVTRETLQDFAGDNVTYLELRTTPRRNCDSDEHWRGSTHDSGEEYLDAIIAALEEGGESGYRKGGISVRLMLSCNRAQGVKRAKEILDLALRYARRKRFCDPSNPKDGVYGDGWVAGLEFSGNPLIGSFVEYSDVFMQALQSGLCCSIHCGEVKSNSYYNGVDYQDNEAVLSFIERARANGLLEQEGRARLRLGHALLISSEQWTRLMETKVPIEICPTSNLMTLALPSLSAHPTLPNLLRMKHPFSLCTDDSSVFQTNLSHEYAMTAKAYSLTKRDVVDLAETSFKHAFGPIDETGATTSAL